MAFLTGKKQVGMFVILIFLGSIVLPTVAQEENHTNYVNVVEWNSDGTVLASGSTDTTIRTWDLSGNQLDLKKATVGPNNSVLDLGWDHSGQTLISGSVDQTVLAWNLTQDVTVIVGEPLIFAGIVEHVEVNPQTSWINDFAEVFNTSGSTDSFTSTASTYNGLTGDYALDLDTTMIAVGGGDPSISFLLHTPLHPDESQRMVELGDFRAGGRVKGMTWDASGEVLGIGTRDGNFLSLNVTSLFMGIFLEEYQTGLNIAQSNEIEAFEEDAILADEDLTNSDGNPLKILSVETGSDGKSFAISSAEGVNVYEIGNFGTFNKISDAATDLTCENCQNVGVDYGEGQIAIAFGTEIGLYTYNGGFIGDKTASISTLDLGFDATINAVDVDINPVSGQIAVAVGGDVIVYSADLSSIVFRIAGEIPVANNSAFLYGILFFVGIFAIWLIRRLMKMGKL